jgi:hypothetical protein
MVPGRNSRFFCGIDPLSRDIAFSSFIMALHGTKKWLFRKIDFRILVLALIPIGFLLVYRMDITQPEIG